MVACRSWTWTRSSTAAKPKLVGVAEVQAGLDAAAGQPHGEGVDVMVAADPCSRDLAHRRAAELAAPDDQRVVEQAALLQVLDQGRARLVDLLADAIEACRQVRRRWPPWWSQSVW